MSFASLLRHRVQLRRRVAVLNLAGEATYNELGHPITQEEVVESVRCRIEPLTAREVALLNQAGAVVGDHRVYFLAGTPVTTATQLRPDPADGRVFEVHRIDDLGGAGRYLEVTAELVTSSDVPEPS